MVAQWNYVINSNYLHSMSICFIKLVAFWSFKLSVLEPVCRRINFMSINPAKHVQVCIAIKEHVNFLSYALSRNSTHVRKLFFL